MRENFLKLSILASSPEESNNSFAHHILEEIQKFIQINIIICCIDEMKEILLSCTTR